DLRARGHAHREVVAGGAMALGAPAVPAALGAKMRAAVEGLQVAQRVVALEHDVAAAPAVAAVRPALGDVGLAAEAGAAVTAAPGAHVDPGSIVQHGLPILPADRRLH